ncbi:hypothetical protein EBH_0055630 [Eimeria brunetti]|uniref:Integrase zinc-binding domain-containing protein n=1 Tax=Eimeria brunetti TaxID=51314 RepID=U6LSE3_9EIME|nr:hypothetical protein EBH_0055630 [Eimeria brunetti]
MAPLVTTMRRLKEIEYKGSFEEVVEKFSSTLAEEEEPSEEILKDLAATWYEWTTERFRREVERRDDLIRQGWVLNSKQDRRQGQDKGWRHEQIQGRTVEALVDTGASRSFIVPSLVTELAMGTSALYPHVRFKVASGEDFVVRLAVEGVAFVVGSLQNHHDFLVAQVPHKMILGADWLWKENVIWDFKERTLCIKKHNNVHRLLCEDYGQGNTPTATEDSRQLMLEGDRKAATEAHQQMASAVRRMGAERAAALARQATKRYKNFRNRGKLIPMKQLLKTLHQKEQDGKVDQLMEIHFVKTVEDNSAGIEEVCAAAKDTHMKINAGSACGEAPGERVKMSEDYGELEVVAPSSGSSHRLFEEWLLNEGVDCQESIKRVLCAHRQLFVDQLPARLPPERVINHTIMLLTGKMLSKGVLYRLNKNELEAQKEIIQNLKNAKWITMTSSPFAKSAMTVGKKDDGSGKQQYRMVINYQELNAITISPEYPLPRIQDILDLLHGAKGLWRICVPTDRVCRQHVMYQAYDHPTAGHMGVCKTYDMLSRLFYRPQMRSYVNTVMEPLLYPFQGEKGLVKLLAPPNRRPNGEGAPDVGADAAML